MEFGSYIRKGVIFTIRGCRRSVWEHPFLVCTMCGLLYTSRSYPYMFSLMVSASPVLVCSALLLGTLLLSGQQSIPETETEKRARYAAIARKNGMLYDGNVDEQNERCSVETYSKNKRDEVHKVGVESGSLVNKLPEIRVGGGGGGDSESGEMWEAMNQQKGVGDGEGMVDHYAIISKVIGELLESESEHDKSEEEDCSDIDSCSDSEDENLDSSSHASWKKKKKKKVRFHEDVEEEVDASDSGSDGAESSSPDASMDDMMPILDELHPLLDEDSAQPVDAAPGAALTAQSPRSSISSSSSIESSEETEAHGSEAADDDDDDDEAEKDEAKSVITWTEEDQKNLMEVGSSELERNQRLERILRRRKNMSMLPEISMIDLENDDFQLKIAPISTSRKNPFDDFYDTSAPGSAPSIMSQRRNPFDLPFDDIADDSREKLTPPPQPFLRRRNNFLARPSMFDPRRQDRQPTRFRPFFVPEQTVSEKPSHSSFQEHETESVSSVEYLEDSKVEEGVDHLSQLDPDLNDPPPVESQVNRLDSDEGQVPNAPNKSSEKPWSLKKLTISHLDELEPEFKTPCCAEVTLMEDDDDPEQEMADSVE